jgi:hypothetical protein
MKKSTKNAESVTAKIAAEVLEKAPKAATKAAKAADKTVKAAVEVAEGVTAEAKTAVAKAAAKAPAKKVYKETVYLQYLGKEIDKDDVIRRIKEVWTKELNHKIGDIHTLTVYMKPEENLAYYVINGDVTGSVTL